MSYKNYKQADSRWGRKNYNGSSTMAAAGCGPTSCAIIISGKNSKITPLDTMRYMQKHGYAIRNQGTAWNGIPSCLKAYGLTNVQQVDKMSEVWSLMDKGYVGVFLFRGGSRGGITWTTAGHYVAVTDHKVVNGKNYVYTRDPGGRNHTGWYCYETQMKGLIPRIWLGHIDDGISKVKKPTGKYSGTIPNSAVKKGSSGTATKNLQLFLNWYGNFKLKADGKCGDVTVKAIKVFQKTEGLTPDGVYGKKSYEKAIKYKAKDVTVPENPKPTPTPTPTPKPTPVKKKYSGTFPTIPPMTARIAVECAYPYGTKLAKYKYSGGKPKPEYKKRLNQAYPVRKNWKFAKSRAGASCDVFAGTCLVCSRYKNAPHAMSKTVNWCRKHLKSVGKLQNGDIATRTNHVMIGLDLKGKMYVANAHFQDHGGTYGIIQKPGKYTHVWRPSCDAYFALGDTFTDVKKLKRFLNWYGNYGLNDSYLLGQKTEDAIKDFQRKEGLKATGKFGPDELAKAKKVKK